VLRHEILILVKGLSRFAPAGAICAEILSMLNFWIIGFAGLIQPAFMIGHSVNESRTNR